MEDLKTLKQIFYKVMNNLLIVESPGKIKKLQKMLGVNWSIIATYGHFRFLKNDGEDNLGFELIGNRVECRYDALDSKSKKTIKNLIAAAKKAERVFVATDPDREGEVIAWHVWETLQPENKNIVRVAFKEITDQAVKYAIAHPRSLDLNLVGSGLARCCLDKTVGYRCSPLVWNLNAKSVGRVQSAVLHLVCDRAREIEDFKPVEYFSVRSEYNEGFTAYFKKSGNDVEAASDKEKNQESSRIYHESEARELVAIAQSSTHRITKIDRQQLAKKPPPPFITSTLQQASGSKLDFSPDRTMKIAQSLYEKGLITYMRTDSVALSDEFVQAARAWLQQKDPKNLPQKAAKFKVAKNSQEAHEAIRPSNLNYASAQLKSEITADEFNLYLLIWKRAIASQCVSARINQTIVSIEARETIWIAKGQMVEFLGYARYWNNLSSDSQLPELIQGQILSLNKAEYEKKRTSPPSLYSEPQLVALMEKKGIGRPSTYSSSIKTIQNRQYVKLSKKKLIPTELGLTVDSFLSKNFSDLIDAQFTAGMETSLDAIAKGEKKWQPYVTNWNQTYFSPALAQAKLTLPESALKSHKGTVTPSGFKCPVCNQNLEQYNYFKENEQKSLLRCSDRESRNKSNHKEVVFFQTRNGNWWSKKYGELGEAKLQQNINIKSHFTKKSSPIKLKTQQK